MFIYPLLSVFPINNNTWIKRLYVTGLYVTVCYIILTTVYESDNLMALAFSGWGALQAASCEAGGWPYSPEGGEAVCRFQLPFHFFGITVSIWLTATKNNRHSAK